MNFETKWTLRNVTLTVLWTIASATFLVLCYYVVLYMKFLEFPEVYLTRDVDLNDPKVFSRLKKAFFWARIWPLKHYLLYALGFDFVFAHIKRKFDWN